jgi:O-antigen ligase
MIFNNSNNLSSFKNEIIILKEGEGLYNNIWPKSFPALLAAFYVALYIIRPWELLFPILGEIRFERIYAIFMILVVIITTKKKIRFTLQSLSILLFFAAIGISAIFAVNPSLSWEPLTVYRNLIIFYFILFFVIRSPYELIFMIISYIFTMSVYLMKAQWEFFIHGQHRYDMGVVRMVGIEGTFGGPNDLAMSIVVSLPFVLFLWSNREKISFHWPSFWRKWFIRFLVFYFILSTTSIVLTNSRSGMVGFILFVLISVFRKKGIWKKIGFVIMGIIILALIWQFMPEQNKERFRTIWDKQAGPASATASAEGREEGFKAGIKMFERFPVTGVGIGNFISYRVPYVDGVALQAHNLIGQLLGETGLIGATTFLFMILIIFLNQSKTRKLIRDVDPELDIFAQLAKAIRNSLILLFFLGTFGHNLYRFNWLWLAAFADLNLIFVKEKIFSLNFLTDMIQENKID